MLKTSEFYSTAAQVIPVLLLALTIEHEILRRARGEPLGVGMWVIGFVSTLVVGELVALTALAEERQPSRYEDLAIWAAIIWSLLLIASAPIRPRVRAIRRSLPPWVNLSVDAVEILAVLALVLAVVFDWLSARAFGIIIATAAVVFTLFGRAIDMFHRGR